MVVAGGAAVVAACSSGQVLTAADASDDAMGADSGGGSSSGTIVGSSSGVQCCINMVTDPCVVDPSSCVADASPDSFDHPDGLADAAVDPFCCNANPDPCCRYLSCGDAITPTCTAKLACQGDGGTWLLAGGATGSCSFDSEAGPDHLDGGGG